MNRNPIYVSTALAVALSILSVAPAGAQRSNRQRQSRRAAFDFVAQMQSRMGTNTDGSIAPERSYALALLQRTDVVSELSLGARQREALQALREKAGPELRQRMLATFGMPGSPEARQSLRGLSNEERKTTARQQIDQMQALLRSYQEDLDKRMEAVLRPNQSRRLHQIDLQWRSPLAMADPRVADTMDLSADQRKKVAALLGEYQAADREMLRVALGETGTRRRQKPTTENPTGIILNEGDETQEETAPLRRDSRPADNTLLPPSNPQEMQARLETARKETEKVRKELGAKALELLTPEQQQTWRTLQGRKFTFRAE